MRLVQRTARYMLNGIRAEVKVRNIRLFDFKRLYPTIDLLILPNAWNDTLYRKATQMSSSGATELDHSARCIQKCFRGYRVERC